MHPAGKYAWREIDQALPRKREAEERVCDFQEIYSLYDEKTVREQASRCIQCPTPPCAVACPLGNRIPEWLGLVAEGRFLEAAELSRSTSNMPEICSRVCPQDRLCEGSCILQSHVEPVPIGAIEKFINEYAFVHGPVRAVRMEPNGQQVAVVGSGPAGLSCADELAGLGYAVTIFEAQAQAGGLLVNGIPAFKLEKRLVDRRLLLLRQRGVRFRTGVRVGTDVTLEQLLKEFGAVFLGTGAQQPKPLGIPGAELKGVLDALPFLIEKNVPGSGLPPIAVEGKRVAVLGGGDTAMDCLRTALRCGAGAAVCLYRRDEANMPGSRKEYHNALEEGAEFKFLTSPVAVLGNGSGHVTHVQCVRMELGQPDSSGRRKPFPVPGSDFTVDADLVLSAFGFDQESFPPGSGLENLALDKWNGVAVDRQQRTNMPGVFAGGDLSRGANLVAYAIQDGRRAALAIHRYLLEKTGQAKKP